MNTVLNPVSCAPRVRARAPLVPPEGAETHLGAGYWQRARRTSTGGDKKRSTDATTDGSRNTILAKARQVRREKGRSSITTIEKRPQNRRSRLDPARRSAVEDRLSQVPKLYRNTYLKAVAGRSPAAGIKAFCMECVGWQRAEVARCTAPACPLWPYRPHRLSRPATQIKDLRLCHGVI